MVTGRALLFRCLIACSKYERLCEREYSAILKLFFEGCQTSFVSILCKVKRVGKSHKEAKTRVENSCSRQCSSDGNQPSILEVSSKLERTKKTNEKTPSFKEIYAGTSVAAHKVFQQRGVSSIMEFSLLHNLQFFAWKLWLKIGCIVN